MFMSNATIAPHNLVKSRDKYGRTNYLLYRLPANRIQGVIVRLPKSWIELHPELKYLVNDWNKDGDEAVTYHSTLAAAKAHLLEVTA